MSDKKEAVGFEKFFIKNWEDWDGEVGCIAFYKCELSGVFAILAGVKEADVVEINNETCKVSLYTYGDHEPFYTQSFTISLVEDTDGESND